MPDSICQAYAFDYDCQRRRVMAAQTGTPEHREALKLLAQLARRLHDAERRAGVPMGSTRECGFCHGQPVRNAASWIDPDAPSTAPCPRCGVG